jgi:pimeloyl-ACP methyl ester carboxylesterase
MSTSPSESGERAPVVLIHGMWMTPLSWEHWVKRYSDRGHRVLAPAWPGLDAEPEQLRNDPSPLRGLGITEIVDHYDKIIHGLDRPPIIIGHSFGGLVTQLLLNRGLGVAGVALSTAAPKGVLRLPYSTLRTAWPALRNPANLNKEAPLSPKQFHWCFTNALSSEAADDV